MNGPARSEQINELVAALVKAQIAMGKAPLVRNKKVSVLSRRSGETYEFEYADLDALIKHVREPLTTNGLWFTQTLSRDDGGIFRVMTTLMHTSGQFISSMSPVLVRDGAGNQDFGSALTYQKRYQLAAILGIASDTDDDANMSDGNEAAVKDRKAPVAGPNQIKAPQKPANKVAESPHEFALLQLHGGGYDWVSFGQEFKSAIDACAEIDTANDWLEKNQNALKQMKKEASRVFNRLSSSLAGVFPAGLIFEERIKNGT